MKPITRTLAIASLAMCTLQPVFAQKYKLTLGKEVKEKVRPDRFIASDDSGNIYMSGVRLKWNVLVPLAVINVYDGKIVKYVKKYDNRLRYLGEVPVTTPEDNGKRAITNGKLQLVTLLGMGGVTINNPSLQSISLHGKTYIVVSKKEKKTSRVMAMELDVETGVAGSPVDLLKLKSGSSGLDSFTIRHSPDGTKALILASVTTGTRKNGGFAAAVVDEHLRVLWSKEFTLSREKNKYQYKSFDVGNDGQLYILSRTQTNRRTAPELTLIRVNGEQAAPAIRSIKFGSTVIDDGYLTTVEGDKPMLVGFYKDKPRARGYQGIYFAAVEENGTVSNVRKQEFSNELIASVFNKKMARKAEKADRKGADLYEDEDYIITEYHKTTDGGTVMIAENYYMQEFTRYSSKGGTTTTHFIHHYGDLLVSKIGSNGELQFIRKIAKSNVIHEPAGIKPYPRDYSYVPFENDHLFIFNDNAEKTANTHARKRRHELSTKSDATFVVKIRQDGSLEKDRIATKKTTGKYTFNSLVSMYRVDENTLAFVMTKGRFRTKKTRIGTLTIN